MENIAIYIYDYSILGGAQRVTYNLYDLMTKCELPVKCIVSQRSKNEMDYGYKCAVEIIGEDSKTSERLHNTLLKHEIGNLIVQVENLKQVSDIILNSNTGHCKLFFVLHSSPLNWVKKYYSFKQYISTPSFIAQYFKMLFYWKPLHMQLFNVIVEKYGIICVSKQAKNELCELLKLPYDTKKICYIYNPIPQIGFNEMKYSKENCIVYAGRLNIEKRPMLMLKVWKSVFRDYTDWKFYILGDGPERNRMERFIWNHHLDRVILTGTVSNVTDYLQKSKISVLFSKYEGLPTSILEAGMLRNALLVSDSDGGVRDIVDDNFNGYIVNAKDRNCIVERLKNLMENDGKIAEKFGNKNKECLQKFSNDLIEKSWREILN